MPYIALAAGRHPGRARDHRARFGQQLVRPGPAAVHRVRGARRVHLLLRSARSGVDRVRQGHPDLSGDRGGDHLGRRELGFGDMFTAAKTKMETPTPAGTPTGVFIPAAVRWATGPTRRSRSARRSRCSCTRTRSRPCSRARRATRSAATPRSSRRTPCCSVCSRCWASRRSPPGPRCSAPMGRPTLSWRCRHLFQENFPSWFAGIAYSRDRHRRTRAVRDHVDRRRQPVHPQHLQGVPQEGRHARRGGRRRRRSCRSW